MAGAICCGGAHHEISRRRVRTPIGRMRAKAFKFDRANPARGLDTGYFPTSRGFLDLTAAVER